MQNVVLKKTKSARKVGILLAAVAVSIIPAQFLRRPVECTETYQRDGILRVATSQFFYERADDQTERTRGLSGRQCIAPSQAMLFVFDAPQRQGFWMKDMKFAIDIVWLDESKSIVHIESNVSPSSYPQISRPDARAQYVIEFHASTPGLRVGDRVDF